jgi:hypothetical protein
MTSKPTEPEDPVLDGMIEAQIERTIGPAKGALPPEILEEVRVLLRLGLRNHPGAREVLEQLRPVSPMERSDEVPTAAFRNRKLRGNGGAS